MNTDDSTVEPLLWQLTRVHEGTLLSVTLSRWFFVIYVNSSDIITDNPGGPLPWGVKLAAENIGGN